MDTEQQPIQFILEELWAKHGGLEIFHQLGRHMYTLPKYQHLVGEVDKIRDAIGEASKKTN